MEDLKDLFDPKTKNRSQESSRSGDGGMEYMKDLFVQAGSYLIRLDLKSYDFDLSSDKFPPKPDIEITYKVKVKDDDEEDEDDDEDIDLCPPPRSIIAKVGTKIYMVDKFRSKAVFEFDPERNSFVRFQNSNNFSYHPIVRGVIECIKGKIYCLSQYSPHSDVRLLLEVFDPLSPNSKWKKLCSRSDRNGFDGFFSFGHKLYILGSNDVVYCFDTETKRYRVENDMFKYKCNYEEDEDGCFVPHVSSMMFPDGGKMVLEDVVVYLTFVLRAFRSSSGRPVKLNAHLYSKDGRLLAMQDLGDVFPEKQYSYHYNLIEMEGGKFCALSFGYNSNYKEGYKTFMTLAVSICHISKLVDNALKIQAEEPKMLPSRFAKRDELGNEEGKMPDPEFVSLKIEKQYMFNVDHLGYFDVANGGFFA